MTARRAGLACTEVDLILEHAHVSGYWSFRSSVASAWLVGEGIRRAAAADDGSWILGLTAVLAL